MNYQLQSFRYRVAVGITFKKLRVAIKIDNKAMTQQYINNDIFIKYSKSWNAAREEALPNTTLENLFIIADYFNISIEELFEQVAKVSKIEIDSAIREKKILREKYNILK
ncbi:MULTISPECIES: hypothetical protein [Weeksellaceae]|uniref:Uncharacterized protein n=3 Tax=Weeksellaceae TaxID=2762318 RepID=A0AAE4NZM0_9FLAO|nr:MULTISPECIES: hypothetical protein [Weeksellaceae]ATL42186.1 hypothetical protein CQS02_02140 [Elizabethkingia miricola]MBE9393691.1 hypothetical protein [Elizabethkingia anophelis]MBE9405708.1 hypothetical protein [Elizabethkingia anophelis]MDV3492909.1 hypothetical protein [Elizabethkingia anophelis]MDV3561488.1 hypothetical protein [Elizabethkingia anophelis]